MDYIQEEYSVRFTLSFHAHAFFAQMQRANQNIVVLSTRAISEVAYNIFFTHDIFHLDARALGRMRGFVAIFIWLLSIVHPFGIVYIGFEYFNQQDKFFL